MQPVQPPAPQPFQLKFNKPHNFTAWLALNRACLDLDQCANFLNLTGNGHLAVKVHAKATEIAGVRDEVVREDQTGIVVANSLPRP